MVPGGASGPKVGPIREHHHGHGVFAFQNRQHHRPSRHEAQQGPVKVLALMRGVLLFGGPPRQPDHLQGDDLEPFGLEAPQDLSDELPLDGVGLEHHQRPFPCILTHGRHKTSLQTETLDRIGESHCMLRRRGGQDASEPGIRV